MGRSPCPYLRDVRLVNRKYRRLPKSFRQEKVAMPCLFVRDPVPKDADTLLIVAGELDCLVAWQYGLEAVSVPLGVADLRWIGEEWDFLKRFKRLLLAFDGDEAGSISRVAPCRPGLSPVLRCLLALPHCDWLRFAQVLRIAYTSWSAIWTAIHRLLGKDGRIRMFGSNEQALECGGTLVESEHDNPKEPTGPPSARTAVARRRAMAGNERNKEKELVRTDLLIDGFSSQLVCLCCSSRIETWNVRGRMLIPRFTQYANGVLCDRFRSRQGRIPMHPANPSEEFDAGRRCTGTYGSEAGVVCRGSCVAVCP